MSISEDKERRDAAFAAHRREQQAFLKELPFWEKLRWLEEAHRMVLHIQKQRTDSETQNGRAV